MENQKQSENPASKGVVYSTQPKEGPEKFGYLAFYDDNAVVRDIVGLVEKFDPTRKPVLGGFFGCHYCAPCYPPYIGETVIFKLIGGDYISELNGNRNSSGIQKEQEQMIDSSVRSATFFIRNILNQFDPDFEVGRNHAAADRVNRLAKVLALDLESLHSAVLVLRHSKESVGGWHRVLRDQEKRGE